MSALLGVGVQKGYGGSIAQTPPVEMPEDLTGAPTLLRKMPWEISSNKNARTVTASAARRRSLGGRQRGRVIKRSNGTTRRKAPARPPRPKPKTQSVRSGHASVANAQSLDERKQGYRGARAQIPGVEMPDDLASAPTLLRKMPWETSPTKSAKAVTASATRRKSQVGQRRGRVIAKKHTAPQRKAPPRPARSQRSSPQRSVRGGIIESKGTQSGYGGVVKQPAAAKPLFNNGATGLRKFAWE